MREGLGVCITGLSIADGGWGGEGRPSTDSSDLLVCEPGIAVMVGHMVSGGIGGGERWLCGWLRCDVVIIELFAGKLRHLPAGFTRRRQSWSNMIGAKL